MIAVKEKQRSLDLPTLFIWFIIYSFIGWVYETTYCFITNGRLSNRGFLFGPLCPIYGLSILVMILLCSGRCSNIFTLFLSCSLTVTLMEYITSFWMEALFNRRWWDYSDKLLNINGRVCLGASLLFGVCGVLIVRYIHPAIIRFLNKRFSESTLRYINLFIVILFIIDIMASFVVSLK
jgi:uncharacterized membrane protein